MSTISPSNTSVRPSYSTRYTFCGKERDEETGYSYFGTRYYNSALSIWLSVDPMSDKYPSTSPYTYCANNPVRLVDPDGRTWNSSEDQGKANGSKVLGTCRTADATFEQLNQYRQAIERSAYRSEFSFDPSDFFNGTLKPAFMISHINGNMGIYDN